MGQEVLPQDHTQDLVVPVEYFEKGFACSAAFEPWAFARQGLHLQTEDRNPVHLLDTAHEIIRDERFKSILTIAVWIYSVWVPILDGHRREITVAI